MWAIITKHIKSKYILKEVRKNMNKGQLDKLNIRMTQCKNNIYLKKRGKKKKGWRKGEGNLYDSIDFKLKISQ